MADSRPNRKVLVVEDDPLLLRAIGHAVRLDGHAITLAASLAEAFAQLDGQDTILLDMELPDGLGLTLLDYVRKSRPPSVRVAVVSGARDDLMDRAAALRPERMFRKPFDIVQLLDWIKGEDVVDPDGDAPR